MKSILEAKLIPEKTSGVYLIKSPSGSIYIGQSICLKRRLIEHKCPSRKTYDMPISKEFLNNNLDDFLFEILETCNPADLDKEESHWISKLKPDLNIATGGAGATGHIVSDELKKRLSTFGKEQWGRKTLDEKERIINLNLTGRKKGFTHSEEAREKIRKTLTGKKQPESVIRKRAESMKSAMIGNSNGVKGVSSYLNNEKVEDFISIREAAKRVGVHPSGISKAVKSGKNCAGFNWKLVE